jgi:predicted O-methyltransferase YrrM
VEQQSETNPYTANKIDEILKKAKNDNYEMGHIFQDGSRFININGHPIFGYCRYYNFFDKMVQMAAQKETHFVEVGSFMGQSSAIMAYLIEKSGKEITFDCVDLFEISDFSDHEHEAYINTFGGDMFKTFGVNLKIAGLSKYINKVYKGDSLNVSKLYDDYSLDMVFLDASHKYEDVVDDINHWWSKLRIGGYLAGDDFDQTDVAKAVLDSFKKYDSLDSGVFKNFGTWYVKKV